MLWSEQEVYISTGTEIVANAQRILNYNSGAGTSPHQTIIILSKALHGGIVQGPLYLVNSSGKFVSFIESFCACDDPQAKYQPIPGS